MLNSFEKMQDLIDCIDNLKKSKINHLISSRIKEFSKIGKESLDTIFRELCFCIMTANCSAEKCIEVQAKIGEGFQKLDESELSNKLKVERADTVICVPDITVNIDVSGTSASEPISNTAPF